MEELRCIPAARHRLDGDVDPQPAESARIPRDRPEGAGMPGWAVGPCQYHARMPARQVSG